MQSIATEISMTQTLPLFEKEACPHCGGFSWYEENDIEVVQRCVCGYLGYIVQKTKDAVIVRVLPENKVRLPRAGTRLSRCLGYVAGMHPGEVTTKDVAEYTEVSLSDIAGQLMVLRHRGFIEITKEGRGVPGGSTWKLTHRAIKKLNLKHGG